MILFKNDLACKESVIRQGSKEHCDYIPHMQPSHALVMKHYLQPCSKLLEF